ncbi:MAG: hypothetical protein MZV64_62050 [Ignavibacteriales bacterium]|nr:hypothetical protein [Ignavibacteriales bacterium]
MTGFCNLLHFHGMTQQPLHFLNTIINGLVDYNFFIRNKKVSNIFLLSVIKHAPAHCGFEQSNIASKISLATPPCELKTIFAFEKAFSISIPYSGVYQAPY